MNRHKAFVIGLTIGVLITLGGTWLEQHANDWVRAYIAAVLFVVLLWQIRLVSDDT